MGSYPLATLMIAFAALEIAANLTSVATGRRPLHRRRLIVDCGIIVSLLALRIAVAPWERTALWWIAIALVIANLPGRTVTATRPEEPRRQG